MGVIRIEVAADFRTTFYHVQVGAMETQEFRTKPVPFWLVCFSDTVKTAAANVLCRSAAGWVTFEWGANRSQETAFPTSTDAESAAACTSVLEP